jgi:hypothetical protein
VATNQPDKNAEAKQGPSDEQPAKADNGEWPEFMRDIEQRLPHGTSGLII